MLALDESQLALKLVDFFTKEEMARGNCTPAEGRVHVLLRQFDAIAGTRCKIIMAN